MGGLWVDYNLMSTIPGLFVIGEANFSDHGANRLGASALMQGLADGYFVLPYTIGDYLAPDQARQGGRRRIRAFKRGRDGVSDARQAAARHQRASARSIRSIASWASCCGSTAAWRATTEGLKTRAGEDPRTCATSSGRERERARRGRGAEPVAREGRPRGRLPRAWPS